MSDTSTRVIRLERASVGSPEKLRMSLDMVAQGAAKQPVVVVPPALAGVTEALVAAMAGAAAGRLAVEAFVASIRERHLTLLAAVASETEITRVTPSLGRELKTLASRLRETASLRGRDAHDRDALLATGERLATLILAAALRSRGLQARPMDATEGESPEAAAPSGRPPGTACVEVWPNEETALRALGEGLAPIVA